MSLNLKYLIICALALILSASCEKTETEGRRVLSPVEFEGTYTYELKSVARDSGFHDGDAIGVLGCYVPPGQDWDEYKQAAVPDFMYNQKVTYDGARWSYSPTAYWPQREGARVNFYAYYPWDDGSGNDGVKVSSVTSAGEPSFVFTLNEKADKDLMVAANEGLTVNDGPVALQFQHVLGKVQFKFGVSDVGGFSYVVNKIRVLNVPKQVTYHWSDGSVDVLRTDSVVASSGEDGKGHLVNSIDPQLVEDFTMLLIPCDLKMLEVTINNEETAVIDLTGNNVKIEKGKELTISLMISLENIQFKTSITDWRDGGSAEGQIK